MTLLLRPQPGPQAALLACPAQEVLFGGARGGGKSHGILLDWLRHYLSNVSKGRVSGVLCRRSFPELSGLIELSLTMFPAFGAYYKYTTKTWHFPCDGILKMRHLERDSDADRMQGLEHTWLAIDELGAFPTMAPIDKLRATLRSPDGIPSRIIFTANPGGAGQQHIKERFMMGRKPYTLIQDENDSTWYRTYIPSRVQDNLILLKNDPNYVERLKQSGSPALVAAWLDGDWDAVIGAFFEGVWDTERHLVEPFSIPESWVRWRALDWGYAAPYSVAWFCQDHDGVIYLYRELYGKGKKAGEGSKEDASVVAKRILGMEEKETAAGIKFKNNPADSAMWMMDGRYKSINDIFLENGVIWSKASKGPGSRVNGWQEMIRRLNSDTFKVFNTCQNWIDTVPNIPADPKNYEDVDTDAIDHCADMTRYSLVSRQAKSRKPKRSKLKAGSFDWVATEKKDPDNYYFGSEP